MSKLFRHCNLVGHYVLILITVAFCFSRRIPVLNYASDFYVYEYLVENSELSHHSFFLLVLFITNSWCTFPESAILLLMLGSLFRLIIPINI